MACTIAFFGTKPYDESSFTDKNKEFGFEIRYYKGHLNKNNVLLTQGVDAVCIFVNDIADAEVLRIMASNGVKLLALRCAGFNNVDLNAAAAAGITVVRVPAYSPSTGKFPVPPGVPRMETFPFTDSWGSICTEKQQASSARERLQRS